MPEIIQLLDTLYYSFTDMMQGGATLCFFDSFQILWFCSDFVVSSKMLELRSLRLVQRTSSMSGVEGSVSIVTSLTYGSLTNDQEKQDYMYKSEVIKVTNKV